MWTTTPSHCIIDVKEFFRQVWKYTHLVKPEEVIVELKVLEKRMVSIFIMKKLNQIFKSTKEYIVRALADIRVHVNCSVQHKKPRFPNVGDVSTYSVKLYEERLAEQSV